MVLHCWDRSRRHHGPCCMTCVIEETDRRAGAEVTTSIRETHVRQADGQIVAVVRACCFHELWMEEAVTEAITREMAQ